MDIFLSRLFTYRHKINERINIPIKRIAYGAISLFYIAMIVSCSNSASSINKSEQNAENIKNENVATSKLLQDKVFLNKLHKIRNPKTNSSMIVDGKGKIILFTMEPVAEQIDIIDDIDENTNNYIYKVYYGEGLKKIKYNDSDTEYSDLTMRCVFYDREGKEVGLTTDTYGAIYTTKDKIIYRDNSVPYGERDIRIFNVNTKETTALDYKDLTIYNGNFIMSTDPYGDDKAEKEEMIVCDENFNEIKRISGYSYNTTYEKKGTDIICVSRIIKNRDEETGIVRKFNYLDENYNLIFDEDVDETLFGGNSPYLTIKRGDTVFDYDIIKKEKVGEDRPYEEKKTQWEILESERNKYNDNVEKLVKEYKDYAYIDVFCHGDDVLYFAHKSQEIEADDDYTCDVYDFGLKKVLELKSLNSQYDKEGYFFANKDTVYNSKLEVVKKFDTKCMISKIDKFDKTFFANSSNADYSTKRDFELYDINFNTLYEHIDAIEVYSYDDYIVLVNANNTLLLDKDLNVSKEIEGRSIDIRGWYGDVVLYKVFDDLKSNRMGIIDSNYNIIVDNIKNIEMLTEKYFTYQNGFKYGIMDYEGIPVFTYSIFDTMKEDAVAKDFDGEFVNLER